MHAYVITIETVSDSNKTTTLNVIYASLEAAKDIESIQKDVLADRHHCYKSQILRSSKRCSKYAAVRSITVLSYNGDVEETVVIKIKEEAMFGFNK